MSEDKGLLTYCGLYCGDCLGYTGVIADAAEHFVEVLEKYKFDRTAKCVFPKELGYYDKLQGMLKFMAGLRCPGICRRGERDGKPSGCEVRDCCRQRGFYACYECDQFETCDTQRSLHEGLQYEACVKNMRAIRKMGLEAWLVEGERHCYWDERDD